MAKNTCYMCEEKATSREHVPPKCIFPEKKDLPKNFNFRKNLISVPSCDLHNSHKSMDDEYLMFVLSTHLVGNEHKARHFYSKVKRAIERKPHVYREFMKNQAPVKLVNEETGEVQNTIAYVVSEDRFNSVITHIAHGIYFHHKKEKWCGEVHIFTPMLADFDSEDRVSKNASIQSAGEKLSEVFSSATRYGSNPEIFQFSMASGPENQHVIQLEFYSEFKVSVFMGSF